MYILHLGIAALGWLAMFNQAHDFEARDTCPSDYNICAPPGATSIFVPSVTDPSLTKIYTAIVLSSLPPLKRSLNFPISARTPLSLCCPNNLACLTMHDLTLPFCYDRFTTNYFLAGGSFGSIMYGTFNSSSGDVANLLTGEYTLANGHKGNIYSLHEAAKPDTANLPMPTPYTSKGVGSAIPASALGVEVTATPGTYTVTVGVSTRPASTAAASTIGGSIGLVTKVLASTMVAGGSTSVTSITATVKTSYAGTVIAGTSVAGVTIEELNTITVSGASTQTSSSGSSGQTMTKTSESTLTTSKEEIGALFVLISGLCVWLELGGW